MRGRTFRRHHADRQMRRRLSEDRNQHYLDLTCACWTDRKAMAMFREQPKRQQCYCCSSQRYNEWATRRERLTMQERRSEDAYRDDQG